MQVIGPGSGGQACGETGEGRMWEPLQIRDAVSALLHTGCLNGVRVVLTAGPTREPIDPVRFITNRSSGKMGYALADALARMGAEVTLVSGPTALAVPGGTRRIDVETADEMLAATQDAAAQAQILIGAAAVADYRLDAVAEHKIKKKADTLEDLSGALDAYQTSLGIRETLADDAPMYTRPFAEPASQAALRTMPTLGADPQEKGPEWARRLARSPGRLDQHRAGHDAGSRVEDAGRLGGTDGAFAVERFAHWLMAGSFVILGLTGLLLSRSDGDLTEEQETQLRFIKQSTESLYTLVNDLPINTVPSRTRQPLGGTHDVDTMDFSFVSAL